MTEAPQPHCDAARLRAALERIRDAQPWLGDNPDFGSGHDMAREAAADIAREALGGAS